MARIHIVRRKGEQIGFSVDLGLQRDGKRERRFFKTWDDAQKFSESYKGDPSPTGILFERKNEILHCYERLRDVGASFNEATEFFLKHGARKGNPEIKDVVSQLIKEKEEAGRKKKYLINLNKEYAKLLNYFGEDKKIAEIETEDIRKYIKKIGRKLNNVSKLNILRNLSLLFNYAIKKRHLGLNPISDIDRPKINFNPPSVMKPEDFKALLNYCLENKWYDRVAVFLLIGFCGIRKEEAAKLTWGNVDYINKKVYVPAEVAKKGSYRRNKIPKNAMIWFERIKDERRKGLIIGGNWENLMRNAVIGSKIEYKKNCIRHSFCSYALEAGWPLADVVAYMGHNDDPQIIKTNYRELVEPKDAKGWWCILPDDYLDMLREIGEVPPHLASDDRTGIRREFEELYQKMKRMN